MAYQIALDSSTAASQNEGNPTNWSYAGTTPASFTFDLTRGAQQVLNDGTTYHYTIQNVSGDSLTTPVENGFVANTGDFTTSGGAGTAFTWTDAEGKPTGGMTVWSIPPEDTDQFAPSKAPFMINYRVEDLLALVAVLKAEGCNVLDKIDDSDFGKFAWVIDPEGNKVELWQPPAGQ